MEIKDGGFLQSKEWISFQDSAGKEIAKLQKTGEYSANTVEYTLPIIGKYLFIPRGPVFSGEEAKESCANKLSQIAKGRKAVWIRIEPQNKDDLHSLKKCFKKLGYKTVKSRKDHQPSQTLMLSLEMTKDELLAQMKAKTRYNIRLAERKGVKIEKKRDKESIDAFIRLSKETAKRDGIVIHPGKYYRKMIETIPEDMLVLYIAEFRGEVIGAALTSFYGTVATYLHGASSNTNRNVMAPALLQWAMICEAKKRGMKKYDFGGTKIEKDESGELLKNNWAGISKFKLGFCPKCEPVSFPGCWDVVIDKKKYYTYRVLQRAKDLVRGLKMKIRKNG